MSQPVVPVATADPAYDGATLLACPSCGAAVRPDQDWCTLCHARFGTPEPDPAPEPEPRPASPEQSQAESPAQPQAASVPPPAPEGASADGIAAPEADNEADHQAELERQADELLTRLAADPAMNRPVLPAMLATKGRRILTTTIAAVAFSGLCWFGLVALGVIFH